MKGITNQRRSIGKRHEINPLSTCEINQYHNYQSPDQSAKFTSIANNNSCDKMAYIKDERPDHNIAHPPLKLVHGQQPEKNIQKHGKGPKRIHMVRRSVEVELERHLRNDIDAEPQGKPHPPGGRGVRDVRLRGHAGLVYSLLRRIADEIGTTGEIKKHDAGQDPDQDLKDATPAHEQGRTQVANIKAAAQSHQDEGTASCGNQSLKSFRSVFGQAVDDSIEQNGCRVCQAQGESKPLPGLQLPGIDQQWKLPNDIDAEPAKQTGTNCWGERESSLHEDYGGWNGNVAASNHGRDCGIMRGPSAAGAGAEFAQDDDLGGRACALGGGGRGLGGRGDRVEGGIRSRPSVGDRRLPGEAERLHSGRFAPSGIGPMPATFGGPYALCCVFFVSAREALAEFFALRSSLFVPTLEGLWT